MKISLCMIVKNEEDKIKNCLDSVQQYVQEICITDTGSTDDTLKVLKKLPYSDKIKISHFNAKTNPEGFFEDGHIFSFCKARDFNFKQATGDWILWLDADDVLKNPHYLGELINSAEQNSIDGFMFPYWYLLKEGRPVEVHWKLQFVRKSAPISWKGNVHEDYLPDGQVKLARTDTIIRVHEKGAGMDAKKSERNLRILVRELQEQGDNPDPRTLFYAARSYMVIEDDDSALPLLEKYVTLSGWREELYEAHYLLADIYLKKKDHKQAIQVCLSAIELRPDFPDCFFTLGRIYLDMKEYRWAEEWLNKGLAMKPSNDAVTHFPHRYTTQPLAALAIVQTYVGKVDQAKITAEKSLSFDPTNKNLQELQNMILYLKKRQDVAKAYVMAAGYLRERKMDWKIPTLIGTVPEDMQADPLIGRIRAQWCPPKKWADNSIAIVAFGAVEAWSPKNEKEGGIGGSEEAVLNLSRELVKLGYDVTVFSNVGADDGDYEGVHWKMFTEFNIHDEFDTIVIWRQPSLVDYKFKAKTVLFDMHDVPYYGDWTKKRLENVKKLMVKSNYHRSLLPEVPDDKVFVVGNGIKLDHFKGEEKRQANRCIYSSAMDRGIDILLETIWPRIKAEVPDAELHVYYGWKTFEELNKNNPERMEFMAKIKKLLEETPGVVYHGRVDHETIAKEYEKSDVWLYPTYFPEIHCITALKAQKGGAIPVCTDYAALDETVQNGIKVHGDIYLPEVQEEYIQKAIELLKDPAKKESIRAKMHEWADKNSWEEVAKAWKSQIQE